MEGRYYDGITPRHVYVKEWPATLLAHGAVWALLVLTWGVSPPLAVVLGISYAINATRAARASIAGRASPPGAERPARAEAAEDVAPWRPVDPRELGRSNTWPPATGAGPAF